MIVRLLGSDAEIDYPDVAMNAVKRLEEKFPCPDWAVIYEDLENDVDETDAEAEEVSDQLVLCRRFSGVLLGVAFVGLDEIEEMDKDGFDWVSQLQEDMSKTTEQLEQMREEEREGVAVGATTRGGGEDVGKH